MNFFITPIQYTFLLKGFVFHQVYNCVAKANKLEERIDRLKKGEALEDLRGEMTVSLSFPNLQGREPVVVVSPSLSLGKWFLTCHTGCF